MRFFAPGQRLSPLSTKKHNHIPSADPPNSWWALLSSGSFSLKRYWMFISCTLFPANF